MDPRLIFFICIFGLVGLLIWGVMQLFFTAGGVKLRQRLTKSEPGPTAVESSSAPAKAEKPLMTKMVQKMGQVASKPFLPDSREKQSALRKKLAMAGMYSPSAIRLATGCKVILLIAGLGGGAVVGTMTLNEGMTGTLMGASLGALIGYLIPTIWLRLRIRKQQKALEYGLPDALDLLVVCVEAGLATDSAMQRVGQEIGLAHPVLSRELEITHMETRIGLSRAESLKNLGQRTGSQPLQSLASMMIQADRFGTSIGTALRVHAESLRMTRQYKAEEQAAKASVKMSFPLVLFIFPSTFIVLAGPTVVKLMDSALFK